MEDIEDLIDDARRAAEGTLQEHLAWTQQLCGRLADALSLLRKEKDKLELNSALAEITGKPLFSSNQDMRVRANGDAVEKAVFVHIDGPERDGIRKKLCLYVIYSHHSGWIVQDGSLGSRFRVRLPL